MYGIINAWQWFAGALDLLLSAGFLVSYRPLARRQNPQGSERRPAFLVQAYDAACRSLVLVLLDKIGEPILRHYFARTECRELPNSVPKGLENIFLTCFATL